MNVWEMTRDQVCACAYAFVKKGYLRIPKADGRIAAGEVLKGDFLCWNAKAEEVKRFWRAAKKDLRDRQLRGGSYAGDYGRVLIGGRYFGYHPKCGMLVREDLALVVSQHWREVLWDDGRIREPEAPEKREEVTVDPLLHQWKDVRARALKLPEITGLMRPGEWNTDFDMRRTLNRLGEELARTEAAGEFYTVCRMQADMAAALVAYRSHDASGCIDHFLGLAATAIATAHWVQARAAAGERLGR